MSITITPLSDFLGAEIGGLDMHQPMDAADLAAVERAFLEHRVLRFRDGPMDVRQLAAFSRQFGELQPHVQRKFQHPEDPNVVEMRNFGDDGFGVFRRAVVMHNNRPSPCREVAGDRLADAPRRAGNQCRFRYRHGRRIGCRPEAAQGRI